jgi:hypothetical protein
MIWSIDLEFCGQHDGRNLLSEALSFFFLVGTTGAYHTNLSFVQYLHFLIFFGLGTMDMFILLLQKSCFIFFHVIIQSMLHL